MPSERALRAAEFVVWVGAVSALVVAPTAALGYLADGLVGAKRALFLVGVLLFGLGSYGIQPAPPHKERRRFSFEGDRPHPVERKLQRVPPLVDAHLPFERRVGRGPKVFVTSLVVLAVSALLEFGVGVGP